MSPSAPDEPSADPLQAWIDAGLFLPEDDTTGQRREVLEWLGGIGYGPSFFGGLTAEQLPSEINRRMLQPGRRMSFDETAGLVELSRDDFDRVCRAAGYPSDYLFTDDDVQAFQSFAAAMALFSEDELLHFIRVLSSSMGRIADAATAIFRLDISPELETSDAREVEWAMRNNETIELIDPMMVAARTFMLRELGLSSVRNDEARSLIGDTANTSTLRLAVGFVDLVGYTSISGGMSPDDLGRFIREFEARAHDVVTANGGRVVKLIGDEVMFVNISSADACRTAMALIDSFEDEEATPSGGIATGEVVGRGGDYYGSVVNLAARIAALAVTGEVLVDVATAENATGINFEPAGRRMLKGFPDPVSLLSITS